MLGAYLNKFVINLVGVSPYYTSRGFTKTTQTKFFLLFFVSMLLLSTLSNHFFREQTLFVSINYYNQSFWKKQKKIISMHPNTSKTVAQLKKKKPVKFNKLRTNLCARRAPSSATPRRRCPLAPPGGAPRKRRALQYIVLTVASAGSIAFHRCRGTQN